MDHAAERPTDEVASWSVTMSELERWAARVAADGSAEPYLAGQPPSGSTLRLETVTEDGMHLVVAVGRVVRHGSGAPHGTETPELTEAELADARSAVRALLDLTGHQTGPATTDVVLTASGPHVIACWLGKE